MSVGNVTHSKEQKKRTKFNTKNWQKLITWPNREIIIGYTPTSLRRKGRKIWKILWTDFWIKWSWGVCVMVLYCYAYDSNEYIQCCPSETYLVTRDSDKYQIWDFLLNLAANFEKPSNTTFEKMVMGRLCDGFVLLYIWFEWIYTILPIEIIFGLHRPW